MVAEKSLQMRWCGMWMAERLRNVKKVKQKEAEAVLVLNFITSKEILGWSNPWSGGQQLCLFVCLVLDVGSKLAKLYISVEKKKETNHNLVCFTASINYFWACKQAIKELQFLQGWCTFCAPQLERLRCAALWPSHPRAIWAVSHLWPPGLV